MLRDQVQDSQETVDRFLRENDDLKIQQKVCLSKLNNFVSFDKLKENRNKRIQESKSKEEQIK